MRVYFANGKTAWLDEIDPRAAPDTLRLIGANPLRLHDVLDTRAATFSRAPVLRFYAEDC